jgi:hypothetical protein
MSSPTSMCAQLLDTKEPNTDLLQFLCIYCKDYYIYVCDPSLFTLGFINSMKLWHYRASVIRSCIYMPVPTFICKRPSVETCTYLLKSVCIC